MGLGLSEPVRAAASEAKQCKQADRPFTRVKSGHFSKFVLTLYMWILHVQCRQLLSTRVLPQRRFSWTMVSCSVWEILLLLFWYGQRIDFSLNVQLNDLFRWVQLTIQQDQSPSNDIARMAGPPKARAQPAFTHGLNALS